MTIHVRIEARDPAGAPFLPQLDFDVGGEQVDGLAERAAEGELRVLHLFVPVVPPLGLTVAAA